MLEEAVEGAWPAYSKSSLKLLPQTLFICFIVDAFVLILPCFSVHMLCVISFLFIRVCFLNTLLQCV